VCRAKLAKIALERQIKANVRYYGLSLPKQMTPPNARSDTAAAEAVEQEVFRNRKTWNPQVIR
jgi:hypothetical protein